MGEKTENAGGEGKPSAPDDLKIPGGQKDFVQNDFVAAVERRSSQLRDDPATAPNAPRRRRRWLATILGILVLAIVVVGLLIFTEIGRQSGNSERVTGSLVPSDNATEAAQSQAGGEDAQEAGTAGDTDDQTEVLADAATDDDTAEMAEQPEEQAETSSTDVDEALDSVSTSELTEAPSATEIEIPEALDLPEIEAPLEPVDEIELDATTAELEADVEAATQEADVVAEALPEPSELPSTTADDGSTVAAEELTLSTDADQVAAVEPTVTEIPVIAAGKSDGDRVQLASYGTEERAQAAWSEYEAELADILGSHVPMIEEAILESGTFYRLQIASFGTAVEARDFCTLVLERRLECIVVPR